MAVKLASLAFLKRIPKRVNLNATFSSLSCANVVHINSETDHTPSKSSDFESKIQFLKNKLHPDILVHVLDSTTDVNSSLKLFKWASLQKTFKHNVDTYYLMILKLGLAGNIEEMEGFCNEMLKEKCPGFDEAFLGLIECFVRNDRLDEALRVLSCMNSSSFKPSIGVFNIVMGALLVAKRDFKDVLFVYKEMVKVGIVPNVETLNYLLEALLEDDRVGTALEQYRRMNKKGCSPNSRTFEVLISGLIARERIDESLLLLDEIFELRCEVDLSFYTRIVPLLCQINKCEAGMMLLVKMKASKISPDSSTYGAMIICLCQNLYVDEAVNLFEEMVDSGITPEDDLYVDIVKGFCTLCKFSEAKKFLVDNDVDITCPYNALLGAYCSYGNLAAAKDLFDDMFERSLTDSLSWNFYIRCLCEIGDIKKALEVLCRMIVFSFLPDSTTYSALIIGRCKQDELDDAILLFNQVQQKCDVLDSVSYAELVRCLSYNEKIQEAAEVYCYMSGKQVALQSTSFDLFIKGLCAIREVKSAIRFLSLAHCSGTSYSSVAYYSIMRVLSKLEKADDLLVVLSRMIVDGCPVEEETYFILIESMSLADNPDHCARFFNVMLSKGLLPNSETLTTVLSCLDKHSQMHMILSAMDQLISCSNILGSSAYNMLIRGLLKEGYRSAAGRLLDVMLGKGWIPSTETHQLLVGSVVKEESEVRAYMSENFGPQDEVSSILENALAQT
ncbi:pentatricopeptide repeat-containing protein At1g09900-like [Coffea eugenioides]|uniref:pentatricopeptide repeat-containing protein At1g09900-like n=1 Tax=Coffea eugenioides TaxID=49369 RepID=UPI000F609DB5|nr:pentatricopeptide repeat-containing protein At1g09900-like [Coffea eugenioides]XP_027163038.1 pentatricopeptide repeat-containing protein At1g09900-like [Coffea eugenioides]